MKNKFIAIFHNLKPGGGLNQIANISHQLKKLGYTVEIFSHQEKNKKIKAKQFYFPVKTSKTFFGKFITLYRLHKKQKEISLKINKNKYFSTFVFPCHLTQSPFILNYVKKNAIYFFLEPKREFYEITSFDYFKIKKILSRVLRLYEKILDQFNCRKANHIVCNSYFTLYLLNKIYKKQGVVIYPGMRMIKTKYITINNQKKVYSLGLRTMLKGHHTASMFFKNLIIIGKKSHENIRKYLKNNPKMKIISNDKKLKKYLKKFSFFSAFQINEPFGLTTIEACQSSKFVFAKNEGGTCEIINNGLNGIFIKTNNIPQTKGVIKHFLTKDKLLIGKTCIIDWKYTAITILNYINIHLHP